MHTCIHTHAHICAMCDAELRTHVYTHMHMCVPCLMLTYAQFIVTPWIAAHQAPLTLGFPRQEYWSGWPFLSSGDLPNPRIKPVSPTLAGGFFTTAPLYKYFSVTHCDARFINIQ